MPLSPTKWSFNYVFAETVSNGSQNQQPAVFCVHSNLCLCLCGSIWSNNHSLPRVEEGCVCVCVCVCPHATTVWTDPQQYVRENTLQSAQQTTVHYCMITICLWDCGFKPGSDPAGDSRPISFHLLSLGCVLCTVHCILIRRALFLFCFLRRGLLDPAICLWWTMTKNSLLSSLIFLLFFFGADSKASSGPLPVCSRWCQIE